MEKLLALEMVRVTEVAAIASARLIGRGDRHEADRAATEAKDALVRAENVDGTIVIGETLEDSYAEVELDATSIETKTGMRDDHLRSADFLDAETYPKLTFRSREIRPTGDRTFQLVGDLTIKDVTNEVVLDAEFHGFGTGPMPDAPIHAAFSATAEIDREDWGMTWNVAVETGGWLVSKKVRLEIETEIQLQA